MKAASPTAQTLEYHDAILRRHRQTLAVLKRWRQDLRTGSFGVGEFEGLAEQVRRAVAVRDEREADFRAARGAFRIANAELRTLSLKVPLLIAGKFDKGSSVASMLPSIWVHVPRTPAITMKRARALLAVWEKADEALAARVPMEDAIVREGVGRDGFAERMAAVDELARSMENVASDFRESRQAVRKQARSLDKLNKRFFGKLKAEARSDAALGKALEQITTEPPSTRGRRRTADSESPHQ